MRKHNFLSTCSCAIRSLFSSDSDPAPFEPSTERIRRLRAAAFDDIDPDCNSGGKITYIFQSIYPNREMETRVMQILQKET